MLSESHWRSLKAAYISVKAFEHFQEHLKFVQKLFLEFPLKVPTKISRKSPRKIPRFLKVTGRLINYWMPLGVFRKIFGTIFGNSRRLRKDGTRFTWRFLGNRDYVGGSLRAFEGSSSLLTKFGRLGWILKGFEASENLWRLWKVADILWWFWAFSRVFWISSDLWKSLED